MRLIDTHCHLYDEKAFPDSRSSVAEAAAAGVDRLVVVGIDSETSKQAIALADGFPGVYAVVGWHPTSAGEYSRAALGEIEKMLAHPKVVAVGEIGLDFYWDKSTPEQQYVCLEDQLDLASRCDKPVVFHCRDANDELITFLERRPPHPYLFHCFSGDAGHAERAVKLDCYFGVDGPITYPKNDELRSIFAFLPADRIVVETDSPYMAPVPNRGKRNRPAWVTYVNESLARARRISVDECAELTTANAERFFRLS